MQTLQGDDDWVETFMVEYDPVEMRYDGLNPMYDYSRSLYYTWRSARAWKLIREGFVLAPRHIGFAELADMLIDFLPNGLTS